MREFVRGAAWWTEDGRVVRADPADRERLPGDTWERAGFPAGVRLEFTARGVSAVEVAYTASPASGVDASGADASGADAFLAAPPVFTLLAGKDAFDTPAAPGEHLTRIQLPYLNGDITVHLPETLRPVLHGVRAVDGTLTPAARRPRWLVYGDSIAEGWSASRPHLAWPALAGRALGVETVNLGYAGAARGESASAEQLAALDADLITVAFGTNCWSRTPHSARLLYETTLAFLSLVRRGHPKAPLLLVSPVLRPDAEAAPNALGATLGALRAAVERAARDAGADLLPGGGLLHAGQLVDGVHPGDAGHGVIADAVASALRRGQSCQSWAAS
ncbi:GDSL-type esterase/lipase family protein [Streptomyces sp. NPDC048436]|uniref:GDSL-type esterase/lipase family protein n=1 Tax=Streptomyces sp. NPDC048436 TaxID=3365550 RepID=UPI0037194522